MLAHFVRSKRRSSAKPTPLPAEARAVGERRGQDIDTFVQPASGTAARWTRMRSTVSSVSFSVLVTDTCFFRHLRQVFQSARRYLGRHLRQVFQSARRYLRAAGRFNTRPFSISVCGEARRSSGLSYHRHFPGQNTDCPRRGFGFRVTLRRSSCNKDSAQTAKVLYEERL